MMLRLRRKVDDGAALEGLSGRARVDVRTKRLITRMEPGEIAVIDHEDIDRVSAEGLVQQKVGAVIDASKAATGRYPNLGPLLLATAGITILDDCGPEVMRIPENARVMIEGDKVLRVDRGRKKVVAEGRVVDRDLAERIFDDSKRSIGAEIERFAENTIEYIRDERDVLLEASRLPEVRTDFHARQVLIVVRGHDYKQDLAHLRAYIREVKPILVGVDGGADALREFGLRPDMIVGDMDSVSNEALLTGAEVVVHAYPGGSAPGLERLNALEVPSVTFEATGTSEDIAMLLAFERGAALIVAVGTHTNLVEYMDKGRRGMASTFLTRLRVGPILVDAKGVSRLYDARVRRSDLFLLIGAALAALIVAVVLSDPLRGLVEVRWIELQDLWRRIAGAVFG
ncbi:MAG: hypothetical protein GEU78_01525 [Actinobacteria bacterium]|nr:hypothetical protein [Actinomycetota bacterium]